MSSDAEYHGSDRRKKVEPLHRWRWRAITVWIIIFTVTIFWGIRQLRSDVSQLRQDKASIIQLEHTNCGLRDFLSTARQARLQAAKHETNPQAKQEDFRAARGYERLFHNFTVDGCPAFGFTK